MIWYVFGLLTGAFQRLKKDDLRNSSVLALKEIRS